MKEIILTDEQARILASATETVELRDVAGTILVKIDPIDAKALAEHRKRKLAGHLETGIPADRIEAYLQRLHEEWGKSGPFDLKRADEIFEQMYPSGK